MNQKTNIAAEIERNRIALLRIVFCWLATAMCLTIRGDRPLPRRLSLFVSDLMSKAEKATYFLVIAVFYLGQIKLECSVEFKNAAHNFIAANRTITLGALTISGIIKRLKALQHILHNLHFIARQLAKSVAAKARVAMIKRAALAFAPVQVLPAALLSHAPDDFIPP